MKKNTAGVVSIEFLGVFSVFLTLALLIVEIGRFMFVQVQLEQTLYQLAWQGKTGVSTDVRQLLESSLPDSKIKLLRLPRLRLDISSAPSLRGIIQQPRPHAGGPGDLVRYQLDYDFIPFEFAGVRAWSALPLRLVHINRNETDT